MRLTFIIIILTTLTFIGLTSCGGSSSPAGVTPPTPPTASTLSIAYTGSTKLFNTDQPAETDLLTSSSNTGITVLGYCEVTANWTLCNDSDFQSYTLYRSITAGISSDTTNAFNMGVFTSASESVYVDVSVDWNTPYFYAILTRDTEDLHSWSNEGTITTPTY